MAYWNWNGGLPQWGYPISGVMQEVSDLDGKPYLVQYFERAVFECHPEESGTAFSVLLSQLGAYQYRRKYPQGAPGQRPNTENPYYFAETGHTLGGEFRAYWEQHGGLIQQGYPVSDEFTEVSSLDAKSYTVQYFERAVFEYHHENQPPYRVLLSQLGTLRYRAKYPAAPGPTPTPDPIRPQFLGNVRPGETANLTAGGSYIFWLDANSPWGDPAILGYDTNAHRQFVVTQAPRPKGHLVTDGRTLAWRDIPNGPNQSEYIRGYDISAHREFPPLHDPQGRTIGSFAVDGDTLYFSTREVGGNLDNQLYAHNWTTGQTSLIAKPAPNTYFIRVKAGNGYVACIEDDIRSDRMGLYLAPGRNPSAVTRVAAAIFGLPSFIISGDHLMWTQGGLRIYTISTGKTQVLPAQVGDYLSANDSLVVVGHVPPTSGPINPVFGPRYIGPVTAVVRDLSTGKTQTRLLPSSGQFGDFVALVGTSALAYVHEEILDELYLQPLP
jgi:hypothetical protein